MIPAWCDAPIAAIDESAREAAAARQRELTKPPGSLGRLETLAIRLAGMQGCACPRIEHIHMAVFAADHGVAAEGVSAFPQAVTGEMVRNFAQGGAAISVLARLLGADLEVVDVGTLHGAGDLAGVIDARVGPGTANLRRAPALTPQQLEQALRAGRDAAERAEAAGASLFIGGEMGIANTTSATAVAAALLARPASDLAGPGTGLDDAGIGHKAAVIDGAIARHGDDREPFAVLAGLGGFEIAALSGAFIACGQARIPVLVDGFIASVAALVAVRQQPDLGAWLLYAHRSAEPGHRLILDALAGDAPLLDLGMRLGEGSGAAVAVPLLRAACALHADMATFADAGVSTG